MNENLILFALKRNLVQIVDILKHKSTELAARNFVQVHVMSQVWSKPQVIS